MPGMCQAHRRRLCWEPDLSLRALLCWSPMQGLALAQKPNSPRDFPSSLGAPTARPLAAPPQLPTADGQADSSEASPVTWAPHSCPTLRARLPRAVRGSWPLSLAASLPRRPGGPLRVSQAPGDTAPGLSSGCSPAAHDPDLVFPGSLHCSREPGRLQSCGPSAKCRGGRATLSSPAGTGGRRVCLRVPGPQLVVRKDGRGRRRHCWSQRRGNPWAPGGGVPWERAGPNPSLVPACPLQLPCARPGGGAVPTALSTVLGPRAGHEA